MSEPAITQVPIHARAAAELSPEHRWECCRISADVASALGVPLDHLRAGRAYRVRVCVTPADVNVLYNPTYVEFVGKSESFVVEGLAEGSQRVEIYANSGPGQRDGGIYKLFGGGDPFAGMSVPANARVSLCRESISGGRGSIERCAAAASTRPRLRLEALTPSLPSV